MVKSLKRLFGRLVERWKECNAECKDPIIYTLPARIYPSTLLRFPQAHLPGPLTSHCCFLGLTCSDFSGSVWWLLHATDTALAKASDGILCANCLSHSWASFDLILLTDRMCWASPFCTCPWPPCHQPLPAPRYHSDEFLSASLPLSARTWHSGGPLGPLLVSPPGWVLTPSALI